MFNTSQEFIYKISKLQLLVMIVIAAGLPFLFIDMAMSNNKGLRFFNLVTLSSSEANLFYWGMAILCGFAALAAIFLVFSNLCHPKQVELHAAHANLPLSSMFHQQLNIPYELINDISRRKVSANQELLIIKSAVGESRLISSHFKGELGYEDFLSLLLEKISTLPNNKR